MMRSHTLSLAIALSLGTGAFSAARGDEAAAGEPTPLPRVTVTAEHESEGYLTERSRTATKTDTPLLDVPQAVSVVTRDLIQDQSMQSLADVARYVPGAGMAQGEGNRDTIILRGNSSTSDFFLDGVRDDVEYFRDLYNVDRVEVLKGPNAMIFGRGGAGGVVNRVSRQANWEPTREIFPAGRLLGQQARDLRPGRRTERQGRGSPHWHVRGFGKLSRRSRARAHGLQPDGGLQRRRRDAHPALL